MLLIAIILVAILGIGYRYWRQHIRGWQGERAEFLGQAFHVHVRYKTLRLGVDTIARSELVLRRETEIDAFVRRIGLSAEYQTGDALFDRRTFIATDDADLAKPLLADKATRELVDRLVWYDDYHLYGKALYVRCGRIWVELTTHYRFERSKTRPMLERVLPELKAFGERLEGLEASKNRRSRRAAFANMLVVFGWGLAVASLSSIGLFRYGGPFPQTDDGGALAGYALAFGVCLSLSLALVAVRALRGTPFVHSVLASVLVGGGIGFSFFAGHASYRLNIALDDAKPQAHRVQVHALERKTRKRAPTLYLVTLDDWRQPGSTRILDVDYKDFHSFTVGDAVQVIEHPGAWGYRWIARVRLPPGDPGESP